MLDTEIVFLSSGPMKFQILQNPHEVLASSYFEENVKLLFGLLKESVPDMI
jgi:hypothetical protein